MRVLHNAVKCEMHGQIRRLNEIWKTTDAQPNDSTEDSGQNHQSDPLLAGAEILAVEPAERLIPEEMEECCLLLTLFWLDVLTALHALSLIPAKNHQNFPEKMYFLFVRKLL